MAGSWACARCGTRNPGTVASCGSCDLLRGAVLVPNAAPPGIEAPGPGRRTDDRPAQAPADEIRVPASPELFGLLAPFLALRFTRARLRERGPRAAWRAISWPAVGLPVAFGATAIAQDESGGLLFLAGLVAPVLFGIGSGVAMPGIAGLVFGLVGSLAGSLVTAAGVWLVAASGLGTAIGIPAGPVGAVTYVATIALLITILTAAQLGIGVAVGSVIDGVRRRTA